MYRMDFREESEMDIPVSHRREDYYLIPPPNTEAVFDSGI